MWAKISLVTMAVFIIAVSGNRLHHNGSQQNGSHMGTAVPGFINDRTAVSGLLENDTSVSRVMENDTSVSRISTNEASVSGFYNSEPSVSGVPNSESSGLDGGDDCGSQTIQCICGIGKSQRHLTVQQKLHRVNTTEPNKIECAGDSDPYQVCANYSCFVASNQNTTTSDYGLSKMKRNIIEVFYPQEFTIPRGGLPEGHRVSRQSEPCFVPPLKNAEIKCWKWPNWMNCDITCIYGHALQGKKDTMSTTNINCRSTENVWKPHGFIDCQPFINCNAHLKKPGDLKCREPTNGPAYCEISCLDYDQYEATGKQRYECVDDTFARTLPHCAGLKEVELVKKPPK